MEECDFVSHAWVAVVTTDATTEFPRLPVTTHISMANAFQCYTRHNEG